MKTKRRLFEHLEHWGVFLMIMVSLFFFSQPAARAEERKSLEEVLVEKGVLSQEEAAAVQGRKLSKWIDRVVFSGDFRLRHESFLKDPDLDRHRQRFRLRLGSEIKVGDFFVGVRLASGDGQQVSTNQSFDNLFSQKQIWIDRAYLQWRGIPGVALTGGKMPNPFFTIPDVVWDEDVNPEGFAQNFQLKLSDTLTLFANTGQFALDEDAADNNDQWLFGEQGGVQAGFGKSVQLTLAGAFYNFKNATRGNFGQVIAQEGNTRVPPTPPAAATNTLVNSFRVLDITAELGIKFGPIPVAIHGDYVKNLADTTTDEDTGYQVGARVGKAGDPQTWEVGYFYRVLETDATVADLTDSDFGDGGTNRKGHTGWVAYAFTKALVAKTKYSATRVEDQSLPPGRDNIKRFQFDLLMKF